MTYSITLRIINNHTVMYPCRTQFTSSIYFATKGNHERSDRRRIYSPSVHEMGEQIPPTLDMKVL
ncbi:protein of unknown function [Methylocaldum szegediense]|uniref:Uncharacterized protein n=1 Tax=Methylocaldum szegediense TaxID=73780 RepID=A0ABM9HXU6_9GAMM|nr:protein of unknown function [Methylocaldum szegediense]